MSNQFFFKKMIFEEMRWDVGSLQLKETCMLRRMWLWSGYDAVSKPSTSLFSHFILFFLHAPCNPGS